MENPVQRKTEKDTGELIAADDKFRKVIYLFINDNLTVDEIGTVLGIENTQVRRILDEYGFETGNESKSARKADQSFTGKNFIPKEILVELYSRRKLPMIEIELMLNTTQYILYKNLEFHGIPRKGRGIYTTSEGRKNSRR